jgi:ferredoxin
MIITKQKPIEKLLENLKDAKNIFLVGCGDCSTTCHTGGEPEILKMKEILQKEGKAITGYCIPEAPCIAAQIKQEFAKHRQEVKSADTILVMACGIGVQSVTENGRFPGTIFGANDTLFAGSVGSENDFREYCSLCGECILDETGNICPLTRCSKGLLNGPCGGAKNEKCEVDKDRDCAWILIYKRLKEKGALDKLRKIKPAKDFSKMNRPRKLVIGQ